MIEYLRPENTHAFVTAIASTDDAEPRFRERTRFASGLTCRPCDAILKPGRESGSGHKQTLVVP